jgi:hypothetical protein
MVPPRTPSVEQKDFKDSTMLRPRAESASQYRPAVTKVTPEAGFWKWRGEAAP